MFFLNWLWCSFFITPRLNLFFESVIASKLIQIGIASTIAITNVIVVGNFSASFACHACDAYPNPTVLFIVIGA